MDDSVVENDGQSQSSFNILQDEKLKTSETTMIIRIF